MVSLRFNKGEERGNPSKRKVITMKVQLHIDPQLDEETAVLHGPEPSSRLLQVQHYIQQLDQSQRLKARQGEERYLVEAQHFYRIYVENRQIIGQTATDTYVLSGPLYKVIEDLPDYFLKISQSEVVNTQRIDHLHFTPSGSVDIHLTNGAVSYSSRRYLKSIKEALS